VRVDHAERRFLRAQVQKDADEDGVLHDVRETPGMK
jgi:hypothetical protein